MLYRKLLGNVNMCKIDIELRNSINELFYLEEENGVYMAFKDIRVQEHSDDQGNTITKYEKRRNEVIVGEDGKEEKVERWDEYTNQIPELEAFIQEVVDAHDCTPIVPPKTEIEKLQEKIKELETDDALNTLEILRMQEVL